MIRSLAASRHSRFLILGTPALALGLMAALVVAKVAMSPPRGELLTLACYLGLTGSVALLAGWLFLGSTPMGLSLGLRTKVVLGSALGGVLGLLNILIIARLMFVSTSHDLWVLAAAVAFSVTVMAVFSVFVAASVAERVELIGQAVRALANEAPEAPAVRSVDEVMRLAADVDRLGRMLRAAEEERARLDEERRELTASVSHDLRTPVANVRAMAEALSAGLLDSEGERRHYAELIQREVERLSRMIDDLFDLARLDAGALHLEPRPLQLEEIASDVVAGMRLQAERKGLCLELQRPPEAMPTLMVDGARIERVIGNLLRNAIEHTPEGGRIEVALRQDDDWIALSVRDSGEGFDDSQALRIFERFHRVDLSRRRQQAGGGDGAGLGLSIVRGFVEAHGGNVQAVSRPGSGSVFTVHLPVSPSNELAAQWQRSAVGGLS